MVQFRPAGPKEAKFGRLKFATKLGWPRVNQLAQGSPKPVPELFRAVGTLAAPLDPWEQRGA